ncbi:hypothetical protein KIW84_024432 [Lathyrus oleraceus]|uniref:Methyltransferase-like protein 23 n=1 Tax=Pisum sativum TaxID=3888 RepID=A0A9D4YGV8_PEA|nr:hypothetical protein KIW84_024432 [Pisum sativum]
MIPKLSASPSLRCSISTSQTPISSPRNLKLTNIMLFYDFKFSTQNMREDYGLYVWPCSVILGEYVWQQKQRFSEANVVELGAGTCLPGLVAAKVGANVTLTDDSSRLEVLGLTWGVWDSSIFDLRPTIILGADVLYDSNAFDDLFATVTFLLRNSPGSTFITSYHNRSGHHLIEFLMRKWGLKCVKLLDGFSILPSFKASQLSGNIQLVEMALMSKDNA